MSKRFWVYAVVSLAAVSVYLPGITHSPLADDWSVIVRNMDLSSHDMFVRFYSTYAGWYRPLFDVLISLCFQMFGFNAIGYHLVALSLYVSITYLVGDIAEGITGKRSIGLVSSLLFGIHGVHAEPVLWISSMNELLAGFFVLLSLKNYIAFRRENKSILRYCLVGLFYLLSLASKETASLLPMMFVFYVVFLSSGPNSKTSSARWREQLPNVPFLIIQTVYLVFRLQAGSPYSADVPLARVAVNALYYFAVQVLMLPENYGYLSSLPLWKQAPLFPVVSVGTSVVIIGILVWMYIKSPRKPTPPGYRQAGRFTCCWSLVALLPVILTAAGRTAFMASIGVVWTIAILLFILWEKTRTCTTIWRGGLIAGTVVFVCLNLVTSSYRVYWWRQASEVTQNVIRQLDNELATIPKGRWIRIVGLPDHLNHAYTFRNAFPYFNLMFFPDHRIHATLDTEMSDPDEYYYNRIVYRYEEGALNRIEK